MPAAKKENVTNDLKDQLIWDNFREGSTKALEIIYEENYSSMFLYAMKFTKDQDLIKDTIQELFIELINSGKRLTRTDNIRFYLLKALRNKLFFQMGKKMKLEANSRNLGEFNLLDSIEAELIQKEVTDSIRKKITSAVLKLSAKQQEVIYLRFYHEMPYDKIASLYDVKTQTVRNLLTRAIRQLKEDLGTKQVSDQMILLILQLNKL
jgi:RNA polymerase sigma-70 factor (ECF subfamily)